MSRRLARGIVAALVLLVGAGCSGPALLTVQLISDLTPGVDVDAVVTVLRTDEGVERARTTTPLPRSRSIGRAARIASFADVAPGRYELTVTLLSGSQVVAARPLVVRVDADTVRTVIITRDCSGVVCADPALSACLGGRCVAPTCSEDDPDACGTRACAADTDCPANAISCAPSRCSASGACFAEPDDALCADGAACDAQRGCVGSFTACDWSSTPALSVPEQILDTPDDEQGLSLSRDGLQLFFTRTSSGIEVPVVAARSSLELPFGAPTSVTSRESPAGATGGVTFRRDGLEAIFSSDVGRSTFDLFRSVRAAPTDPWGAPTPLPELLSGLHEFDTFLELDGLTLWFERQPASGEADVFRARRPSVDAAFGAAEPVPGLSMPGVVEANPWLPDDRSVVVFTSVPDDAEVFAAPVIDGMPGPAVQLDALSSPVLDYEPVIRFDGCEIFFVSARDGSSAIYRSIVER